MASPVYLLGHRLYDRTVAIERTDHYATLGVSKDADQDAVKKAYRRLALELHPDRTGGDKDAELRFKQVNAAYAVLSDPDKRLMYDSGAQDDASFDPGPGFGGWTEQDIMEMFEQEMFGRRQPRQRRGQDIGTSATLTFSEAFTGCKKDIAVEYHEACEPCKGSGDEPGVPRTPCSACGATGVRLVNQGFIHVHMTCPACRGQKFRRVKECSTCHGTGAKRVSKNLTVNFVPGLSIGDRIRLQGMGAAGPAGPGDAYVVVHVHSDKRYKREGDDIVVTVDLNVVEAALGTTKDVTMPDGSVEQATFPPGSQQGHEQRVKNRGMPKVSNANMRGTLKARANIKVPKNLTAEQRDLLTRLGKTL